MMKEFISGLKGEACVTVSSENTAKAVKSGCLDVFATPMLLALLEEATCICCAPMLDEGETTVGIKVCVSHDKASKIGEVISAQAVLESAEGRKLIFTVSAKDSKGDIIGKGTIERFVVTEEKFMKRVQGV